MISQVRGDIMRLMTINWVIKKHIQPTFLKYFSCFSFNSGCAVGYTILSVKQERILEELDDEAKIHIIRGPRTGANSWWQWTVPGLLFFPLSLVGGV